jgi:hypothetical protein
MEGFSGYIPSREIEDHFSHVTVEVEQVFKFSDTQVKAILADYVSKRFNVKVSESDVIGEYHEPYMARTFDECRIPGHANYTVKVKR